MPVDYQQIRKQILEKGPNALRRQEILEEKIEQAYGRLLQYAGQLQTLQELVEAASNVNPDLRCAEPGSQPLTQAFPTPVDECPSVLLAADGSQINPDRHNQIEFGVINAG